MAETPCPLCRDLFDRSVLRPTVCQACSERPAAEVLLEGHRLLAHLPGERGRRLSLEQRERVEWIAGVRVTHDEWVASLPSRCGGAARWVIGRGTSPAEALVHGVEHIADTRRRYGLDRSAA